MGYCPTCGTQLIPVQSVNPDPTPNPYPNPTPNPNQHNVQSTSNSNLMNWLPYVLAVLGLVVSWFIDSTFGFLLSLGGLVIAVVTRSKRTFSIPTIIVSAISVIVQIFWMIKYL